MNLQIKKFDPKTIPDDSVCIFVGKRRTGKSTLITDILYHKRHIPAGIVMSGTEDGNHHYRTFVPDLFIYGDYNKGAVEKVLERQKKLTALNRAKPAFLLMDDCMYDRAFMRDECIRQCFMNGRHWKLFFAMSCQYVMDMTPMIRTNVDYVFVLRENVRQNRENLYRCFFGIFPTFDMFCTVLDNCTENYECLVLDNTKTSNKIEDCVYWYKAPIRKNFRIGSQELWNYHARHYNPRHTNTNIDASQFRRKTQGGGITIKKMG